MCVKCTHTRTDVPKNIRVPIVPSAPVRVAIETTFLPLLTQLSLPTTAHHTLPHHTYPLTPPTNHTPTTLRTYVRNTIPLHRQNTTPTTTQPTPTHPSTTNHTTHTHTHTHTHLPLPILSSRHNWQTFLWLAIKPQMRTFGD